LEVDRDTFLLAESSADLKIMVVGLLQHCILPRCLFSPVDAVYCAKFGSLLHSLKTKNFPTLLYYNKILTDVSLIITMCTADEARRYGRFLTETLKLLWHWHSSAEVFKELCHGFPGFKRKGSQNFGYEDFRHVCNKWHYQFTLSFQQLLGSGDYSMITNAILVLNALLPVYPRIKSHNRVLEGALTDLIKSESKEGGRTDLVVLARMFTAKLKKQEHNLVLEKDFHIVTEKKEAEKKTPLPSKEKSGRADDSGGGTAEEGAMEVEADGASTKPSSEEKRKAKEKSSDRDRDRKTSSKSSRDDGERRAGKSKEKRAVKDEGSSPAPSSEKGDGGLQRRGSRKEIKPEPEVTSVSASASVSVSVKPVRRESEGRGGKGDDEGRSKRRKAEGGVQRAASSDDKGSRGDREKSSKKRDRQESAKEEGDREMKRKRDELIAKKSKRDDDTSGGSRGKERDRDRDRTREVDVRREKVTAGREDRGGGSSGGSRRSRSSLK
jgi:THO complex subunit 2